MRDAPCSAGGAHNRHPIPRVLSTRSQATRLGVRKRACPRREHSAPLYAKREAEGGLTKTGHGGGSRGPAPSAAPTLTTSGPESVGARRDGPASERADHRVAIIIAAVDARVWRRGAAPLEACVAEGGDVRGRRCRRRSGAKMQH